MRDEGVMVALRFLPRDLWAVEEEAGYRAGPKLSSIPLPEQCFPIHTKISSNQIFNLMFGFKQQLDRMKDNSLTEPN